MSIPGGSGSERDFSSWLGQDMPKLGVTEAGGLRAVLEAHGCPSSEVTLAGWLDGTSEPSFDKMRAVLSALNKALPDVDVWQAYDRFVSSEESEVDVPSPSTPDQPSLDSMTRDARLPPGLAP